VDQSVRLWDAAQNPPLSTTLAGHTNLVNSTTFSPDGRIIASASYDQSIRLWDVRSRSPVATLNGHTETVNTLSFRGQDGLLASGSEDGTVRFWDVAAQQPVGVLETGHTSGVKSLFEKHQAASRLSIKRVIATYTKVSLVVGNSS
jgi:WD40 repeat protein